MWVDRSNPELQLFNPETEGLLPTHAVFCESRDAGRTWTDYRELDGHPYHRPMPITGPVLALGDGRLACQFEVNKHYHETGPWRHAAAWKLSKDGGRTWPEHVEIANDPAGRYMYWDARYAVRPNGFCQAAFWTYDRALKCDATIHLSVSMDHGRTWSKPRDTGIYGQVCHPVMLSDERLLLIYVDRFKTRSIRAVLSDDGGQTFHNDTVVYEHWNSQTECERAPASDYLQEMDSWSFGRVDGVATADRIVSIVFYAGNSEATNICFAQLTINKSADTPHPHAWSAQPGIVARTNFQKVRPPL